jgi:hypothetical protein
VKLLINSIISTEGARFMTMDIKDFYLNTPMARFEYMLLRIADMPDDVIAHYNLRNKATPDGYIYCEIQKGMYGLRQAGIIAQLLFEEQLAKHVYRQSKTTPGFWTHDTRPISFSLVVNDFGVKYVGEEHAQHLLDTVSKYYKCSCDWQGERYCGLTIKWDYKGRIWSTSQCWDISPRHCFVSNTQPRPYHRINRTHMSNPITVSRHNTRQWRTHPPPSTRHENYSSKRFAELFSFLHAALTAAFSRHSAP